MTLTSPPRVRPTSRYSWVPAAAGWTVGIIATLSLIASVSPLVRLVIKVPREFVNDYIFNFPDTSFAWAFVLALLAAALAARKRIAWLILVLYMVASIGLEPRRPGHRRRDLDGRERRDHRARLPRRRGRLPGAGPQGVLGQGPARRAGQGGGRAGRRDGHRNPDRLGPAGTVPRHAGTRLPAGLCRQPGRGVRRGGFRRVRGPAPTRFRQRAPRSVRRAGTDGRRDRALPVAAFRERADRRGRIGHPGTAGAVRKERLARLLRHPAGQGRGVRAQRARRHHLPRRGGRVPGQRRPGRRSEGVAAGDRGVVEAVPGVRLGAGRDGRQFCCGRGIPRSGPQRPATRR